MGSRSSPVTLDEMPLRFAYVALWRAAIERRHLPAAPYEALPQIIAWGHAHLDEYGARLTSLGGLAWGCARVHAYRADNPHALVTQTLQDARTMLTERHYAKLREIIQHRVQPTNGGERRLYQTLANYGLITRQEDGEWVALDPAHDTLANLPASATESPDLIAAAIADRVTTSIVSMLQYRLAQPSPIDPQPIITAVLGAIASRPTAVAPSVAPALARVHRGLIAMLNDIANCPPDELRPALINHIAQLLTITIEDNQS